MNEKTYSVVAVRSAMVFFWIVLIFLIYRVAEYSFLFNQRKTLYIATWPLMLDAQYLVDFEKKSGISLKITYFESSEELLSKIEATEGVGYDLIIPSDYTVQHFINKGLLKPLDKQKLFFLDELDKRLLSHYFDQGNRYTIPFYWAVYGLGVNRSLFGDNPPRTWALIYDEVYKPERIVMTNSPREAILITALYTFGTIDVLKDKVHQKMVRDLLIKQKSWVDIYTEERVDELLSSENNKLVFGLSTDITRAMRNNNNVLFIVPDEGSFMVIDSMAIPIHSKNEALAYEFINYLYQPHVIDHHIDAYNMCSPIISNKVQSGYVPDEVTFNKLHFFTDIISESGINNIWIDLLAN